MLVKFSHLSVKTSSKIWKASNVLSFQSLISCLRRIWEGIQLEQPSGPGGPSKHLTLQQPPPRLLLQALGKILILRWWKRASSSCCFYSYIFVFENKVRQSLQRCWKLSNPPTLTGRFNCLQGSCFQPVLHMVYSWQFSVEWIETWRWRRSCTQRVEDLS